MAAMKLVAAALIIFLFPRIAVGARTTSLSNQLKLVLDPEEQEQNNADAMARRFGPRRRRTLTRRMKVETSGDCFVDVTVTCTPKSSEVGSCDELFSSAKMVSCESPPTELEFGFHGRKCSEPLSVRNDGFLCRTNLSIPYLRFTSKQPEGEATFICRDFNGGPGMNDGKDEGRYIVASSPRMIGNEYFAGIVPYESTFTILNAGGGSLLDETMILVYADSSMERLLQLMVFKTSCEGNLALGDHFGSIELVSFDNAAQNKVSSQVIAMYEITITNTATEEATLVDVVALSDDTNRDLWKSLKGETIAPGEEISIVEEMSVNLWTLDGEHFMTAYVSAKIPGHQCSSVGQMEINWDVSN